MKKGNDLKIDILVCHHKHSEYVKTECLRPIQVGRAISNVKLDYCIGDNTGDNISKKNKNWCELTAIYWQWKNVDADFYGLFHYRRYLSFNDETGSFYESTINNQIVKKYSLSEGRIKKICEKNDIIFASYNDVVQPLNDNKIMSVYEHYCLSHYKKDIDKTIEIIERKYPEYNNSLRNVLNSKKCSFGNILIMEKAYFNEYCSFLFSVLEELEGSLDISYYDNYQKRVFGFIAERLTNIFIDYIRSTDPNVKLKQLGLLYICENRNSNFSSLQKSTIANNIKLHTSETINICMSFDEKYLVHAATAFTSLLYNCSLDISIDLYILCNKELRGHYRKKFVKIINCDRVKVFFCEIDNDVLGKLPLNMGYMTIATYYRLLLSKLLNNIDKVIYLDSDIVFVGDVVELWDTPLNGKSVGVVSDELGVTQERRLNFNENQVYFNAGVVIFDLYEISLKYDDIFATYLKIYKDYSDVILFQDQDILNIAFKDDQCILPLKWNLGTGVFSISMNETRFNLNDELNAIDDPGIVHFTGSNKPWKIMSNHPCKSLYWDYRLKISNSKFTIREYVSLKNFKYIKLNYKVIGSYVLFYIHNVKIMALKKSFLKSLMRMK